MSEQPRLYQAARRAHYDALDQYLLEGDEIDAPVAPYATTALMKSLMNGNTQCFDRLLDAGADITLQDAGGETVLFKALCIGQMHHNALRQLLDKGANPNHVARYDCDKTFHFKYYTPLFICAKWGNTEAIELLLSYGADPLIRNSDGHTALDIAKQDFTHAGVDVLAVATERAALKVSSRSVALSDAPGL